MNCLCPCRRCQSWEFSIVQSTDLTHCHGESLFASVPTSDRQLIMSLFLVVLALSLSLKCWICRTTIWMKMFCREISSSWVRNFSKNNLLDLLSQLFVVFIFRNTACLILGWQRLRIFATRDQEYEELADCKKNSLSSAYCSNLTQLHNHFSSAVETMTSLNSHARSVNWLAYVNCTFKTTAWQSSHRRLLISNSTATSQCSRWKRTHGCSRSLNNICSESATFSNTSRQKRTECRFTCSLELAIQLNMFTFPFSLYNRHVTGGKSAVIIPPRTDKTKKLSRARS